MATEFSLTRGFCFTVPRHGFNQIPLPLTPSRRVPKVDNPSWRRIRDDLDYQVCSVLATVIGVVPDPDSGM
jgi:hypothetical protein